MIWDGKTVYALWGYKPRTRWSVNWPSEPLSDGNRNASDRGIAEDIYESDMVFRGPEAELADLETVLDDNRTNFSITCAAGEELFGADVDISGSLDVTVVRYGKIKRVSFQSFSMPLRLRLFSPSFTGSPSFSSLRLARWAYEAGSEFDIEKMFSMENSPTYLDGETDPGIFKGDFLQTTEEMKAIRRYLLVTARSNSVSFPSIGVSEPFGQREGTGPFTVKIIGWEDGGRADFRNWRLRITFARVI